MARRCCATRSKRSEEEYSTTRSKKGAKDARIMCRYDNDRYTRSKPLSLLTRSTAELFFASVEQVDGYGAFRKSGYSHYCRMYDWRKPFPRVAAIQNRLRALVAILYANPSQEITCGYFQAQLESHHWNLLTYVSDSIVCFRVNGSSSTFCRQDLHCNSALADSPQVPYAVWSLAFVARHDRASGGLIGAA